MNGLRCPVFFCVIKFISPIKLSYPILHDGRMCVMTQGQSPKGHSQRESLLAQNAHSIAQMWLLFYLNTSHGQPHSLEIK